jgi:hypothetical protein
VRVTTRKKLNKNHNASGLNALMLFFLTDGSSEEENGPED